MIIKKKYILKMDYMHPFVLKEMKKSFIIIEEKNLKKNNYKKIEAVILDIRKINFSYFDKFINLKLIARFGVGYDNVDIRYLLKKNIKLALTKNSVVRPVAEHTLSLILTILRKLKYYDYSTRKLLWNNNISNPKVFDIYDKRIFLIGYGKIGKKVCDLLNIFGCKIFFYDPNVKKFNKSKATKVGLHKGLKNSDIVSLHLPLNKKTHKFFNKKLFNTMKKDSVLINTSRGKIINEKCLIDKLVKEKNFYAGLDVFYDEPIKKGNKLIKLKNAILTPHICTSSEDARLAMSKEVYKNLINFFYRKPSNLLNLKKYLANLG